MSSSGREELAYRVCNDSSEWAPRAIRRPSPTLFGILSAIRTVSSSSPQVSRASARKDNGESSEKSTKSVSDAHAAEAGTGRTARRRLLKSELKSFLTNESESAVETAL